jgi:LacI family transcriptional regulator
MADVARLARVSSTTVSFVVNDKTSEKISEPTRRRVLAAVDQLGYRPNRAAQNLRTRRTATIGFVIHEVADESALGPAISGAHDAAWRHGSRLIMVNTDRSPTVLSSAIDDLLDRQVDTIVVAAVGTRRITLPDTVRRAPTVLLNCFTAGNAQPCILPAEAAGARAAAQLALDRGHTEIAYLAGLPGVWATRARVRGYRQALAAAGVDQPAQRLLFGSYRADSGYDLTKQLIASGPLPTAILCGNDRMAVGALLALAEAGLRVPTDVSVIGYDDQVALAAEVRPALTTVRLPYYDMGRWAAEHLLEKTLELEPSRTYLACDPVIRDSLGPPRSPRDP